ncbi:hypothetical protein BGZ70_009691 [Mortierella alpina]|uniref:F-box domain-containing protein n=1 Tax=Mortierella alpina TaxID=64518 RepID=A0A9P6J0N1_MORAP|nr:hypothetical protein BGZ70_009691 [Mortierella alpina]
MKSRYFHLLSPAPLDLPEIANNIRYHLSNADLRKCMLVCTIWKRQFAPFLWKTIYFTRHVSENDALLSSYGPYIRQLFTYSLNDTTLAKIAKFCPNLTALELEVEAKCNPASLAGLYSSCNRLEKLSIRLLDSDELGSAKRGPLLPLTMGFLSQLKELRLHGHGNRRYAPLYQTGMVFRCLEGCPLLQVLELTSVRLVDTVSEWDEASQSSFSSPNSVKPIPTHQDILPGLSWLPWNKHNNPRSLTIRTAPSVSSDLSHDSPCTDAMPTPNTVYQSTHLKTLIICNIYTNASLRTGVLFTSGLLQRAPNLTHLSVALAPIDIEDLAFLCPKLKIASFDNGAGEPLPFPAPLIDKYLGSPAGSLMNLRTLQLVRCSLDTALLDSIQGDFKQHGLRHLEISQCTGPDTLALASFLGQCRALETVTLDRFLEKVPRSVLVPRERSKTSSPQGAPRSIRWDCTQIRYLDVYGKTGDKATFEHVLLDLVPTLSRLEFFGMNAVHVGWLMRMEPLRYASPQASGGPSSNSSVAGLERAAQVVDHQEPVAAMAPSAACQQADQPLPLALFDGVKTLSIEAHSRRPDLQYLYHAFPALVKIVYNSAVFPCEVRARDWLRQSPRQIEVVHRSRASIEAVALGEAAVA